MRSVVPAFAPAFSLVAPPSAPRLVPVGAPAVPVSEGPSPAPSPPAAWASASGRPLPVWRAHGVDGAVAGADAEPTRATGHAALDAELPGGGWPGSGLTELLLHTPGCGELRLLAPALAGLSQLWVAPPLRPYAPALAALGWAPERLIVVTPEAGASGLADAAWAAEQALRAGVLGAVLWWQPPEARGGWLPTALRRLHLAAEAGRTPLLALRPAGARAQASPAPLRLGLEPAGATRVAVDVFKRRGPPMAAPLCLNLPSLGSAAWAPAPAVAAIEVPNDVVVCTAPGRVAA